MARKLYGENKEIQLNLYANAEDTLNRMLNVVKRVQNGEYEAAACKAENISLSKMRRFVRDDWKYTEPKLKIDNTVEYSWQEKFLNDIYGDIAVFASDFQECYDFALSTLTEREAKVIRDHFEHDKTLDDIGRELYVTRERVRQILTKAEHKLRHPSRRDIFIKGTEYIKEYKRLADAEKAYNDKLFEARKIKAEADAAEAKLEKPISEEELKGTAGGLRHSRYRFVSKVL